MLCKICTHLECQEMNMFYSQMDSLTRNVIRMCGSDEIDKYWDYVEDDECRFFVLLGFCEIMSFLTFDSNGDCQQPWWIKCI